jgi:hypothetical protein
MLDAPNQSDRAAGAADRTAPAGEHAQHHTILTGISVSVTRQVLAIASGAKGAYPTPGNGLHVWYRTRDSDIATWGLTPILGHLNLASERRGPGWVVQRSVRQSFGVRRSL